MLLRFLFIILLLLPFYIQAEVKVLKIVNGEAISNVDVMHRVSVMEQLSGKSFTETERQKAFSDALENLVNEIILTKKAEEMNIDISEELARDKLEIIAKQNATDLKQYLQQHNIDYHDIIQKTMAQIALEKIITSEVIPHITVNDDEVMNFAYTIFELEKDGKYLGLFSDADLSHEILSAVQKMKIGTINESLSIKLLDRFNVAATRMHSTFNIIEISEQDIDKLVTNNINCQNYSSLVDKQNAIVKNNFTKGTSQLERKIYTELLKSNAGAGQHLKIADSNTLVLVYDVITPKNTEQTIKEKIFQNKVAKHTDDYLKKLRRNNSIITVDEGK